MIDSLQLIYGVLLVERAPSWIYYFRLLPIALAVRIQIPESNQLSIWWIKVLRKKQGGSL